MHTAKHTFCSRQKYKHISQCNLLFCVWNWGVCCELASQLNYVTLCLHDSPPVGFSGLWFVKILKFLFFVTCNDKLLFGSATNLTFIATSLISTWVRSWNLNCVQLFLFLVSKNYWFFLHFLGHNLLGIPSFGDTKGYTLGNSCNHIHVCDLIVLNSALFSFIKKLNIPRFNFCVAFLAKIAFWDCAFCFTPFCLLQQVYFDLCTS